VNASELKEKIENVKGTIERIKRGIDGIKKGITDLESKDDASSTDKLTLQTHKNDLTQREGTLKNKENELAELQEQLGDDDTALEVNIEKSKPSIEISLESSSEENTPKEETIATPVEESISFESAPPPVEESISLESAPTPPPIEESISLESAPTPPPIEESISFESTPTPPPIEESISFESAPPPVEESISLESAPTPTPPIEESISFENAPPPVEESISLESAPTPPPPMEESISFESTPTPPPIEESINFESAPPPVEESISLESAPTPPPPVEESISLESAPTPPPPFEESISLESAPTPPPPVEESISLESTPTPPPPVEESISLESTPTPPPVISQEETSNFSSSMTTQKNTKSGEESLKDATKAPIDSDMAVKITLDELDRSRMIDDIDNILSDFEVFSSLEFSSDKEKNDAVVDNLLYEYPWLFYNMPNSWAETDIRNKYTIHHDWYHEKKVENNIISIIFFHNKEAIININANEETGEIVAKFIKTPDSTEEIYIMMFMINLSPIIHISGLTSHPDKALSYFYYLTLNKCVVTLDEETIGSIADDLDKYKTYLNIRTIITIADLGNPSLLINMQRGALEHWKNKGLLYQNAS